jgi:hypothetical protein
MGLRKFANEAPITRYRAEVARGEPCDSSGKEGQPGRGQVGYYSGRRLGRTRGEAVCCRERWKQWPHISEVGQTCVLQLQPGPLPLNAHFDVGRSDSDALLQANGSPRTPALSAAQLCVPHDAAQHCRTRGHSFGPAHGLRRASPAAPLRMDPLASSFVIPQRRT